MCLVLEGRVFSSRSDKTLPLRSTALGENSLANREQHETAGATVRSSLLTCPQSSVSDRGEGSSANALVPHEGGTRWLRDFCPE